MRVLLPLCLLAAGVALGESPSPLEGEWVLTLQHPRGEHFAALLIEKSGKRLDATWSTMAGRTKVGGFTVKGAEISFVVTERRGPRNAKATLDDSGRLIGTVGRSKFTGRRAPGTNDPELDLARHSMRAAPRDAFPVLTDPPMAAARSAKWRESEMVIGVERNGQSCAFPVTTMGIHELVNITIGKDPLAVSW